MRRGRDDARDKMAWQGPKRGEILTFTSRVQTDNFPILHNQYMRSQFTDSQVRLDLSRWITGILSHPTCHWTVQE